MSRHRSPGGRTARTLRGAPAVRRQQPGVAMTAVRNGMTAAVAGGALAALIPAVAMTGPGADAIASETAGLRLAADGQRTVPGPGVDLVASIAPVRDVRDAEPAELNVADLLKAAGLADVARKAADERAAREAVARCDTDLEGLGRVKPWVRDAAGFLSCLYDAPPLSGVARRGSRSSDHPSGHAVDVMVGRAEGDRIAECALANRDELGISYVIWEQRVNYGGGWERMSDRGGDTDNHYDHVHISFERSAPIGDPVAARCE